MARFRRNRLIQRAIDNELARRLPAAGAYVETAAKLLCAVDTGNLRGSINHKMVEKLTVRIGTPVEYGPFVEFGTRKMKALPFLLPALVNNKKDIRDIIKKV